VDNRDKGLLAWRGKPLVAHVSSRIRPQVGTLVISCNRNESEYRLYAERTVSDLRADYQGPLSGMESAARVLRTTWVAVTGCDTPLLPPDLVGRLLAQAQVSDADICCAHDGERAHYLCAVIRRACLDSLPAFLDSGGRAVRDWYATHNWQTVDFSDNADTFRNINRLDGTD